MEIDEVINLYKFFISLYTLLFNIALMENLLNFLRLFLKKLCLSATEEFEYNNNSILASIVQIDEGKIYKIHDFVCFCGQCKVGTGEYPHRTFRFLLISIKICLRFEYYNFRRYYFMENHLLANLYNKKYDHTFFSKAAVKYFRIFLYL